jgi:beta-phosphoglucomutase
MTEREKEILLHPIFKAAIFDLDGVIVDTAKYHYLAWRELAEKLGFSFTKEDNERLKGVSRIRSLEILLEVGGITLSSMDFERAMQEKNDRYVAYISNMDENEILPGAKEYLLYLRELGIKTALGSASKNAPLILKRLGLHEYFDGIADGNSVSRPKPAPDVFLEGARLVHELPHDCAVFEDAKAGVEAAKAAGMFCVGVGNSEMLAGADIVIEGFTDFIGL